MKWYKVALLLVLLVLSSFALAEASTDAVSMYVMPSALQIIGEEAFEATGGEIIVLSEATTHIHDRAFADNEKLRVIFIPSTTVYIGEDAFDGSDKVTIYGVLGSYAQEYARRHGIRFFHFDIWHVTRPVELVSRAENRPESVSIQTDVGLQSDGDMNDRHDLHPKEKPGMYPIDYNFP